MTKSLEDYIEVVYVLIHEKNRARVRDIASTLKVKMPSVVKGISELKKLELVTQEPYGDVELTAKGRRIATIILNRHNKIRDFLMLLGVSRRVADCIRSYLRKSKESAADGSEKTDGEN